MGQIYLQIQNLRYDPRGAISPQNVHMMMAHVAHKEHTMTPDAAIATHPNPMGPIAVVGSHRGAQGAHHTARQLGDSKETINIFRC